MFTKTIVKPRALANAAGLSKEHLKAVIADLSPLGEIDKDAAKRVIEYVVEDTGDEVLLTVGGWTDAADILNIVAASRHTHYQKAQKIHADRALVLMPRGLEDVPGSFWARLFNVYEATTRTSGLIYPSYLNWPSWLTVAYLELMTSAQNDPRAGKLRPRWSPDLLEAVMEENQTPARFLPQAQFDQQNYLLRQPGIWVAGGSVRALFDDESWKDCFHRHPDAVRAALTAKDAHDRIFALQTLSGFGYDGAEVVDILVQMGTGTAKTVREAALPLLDKCKKEARPLIEQVLADGNASERNEAAALLWRLFESEASNLLRSHAEQESSDRVKQTINKLVSAPVAAERVRYELPPVEIETGELPLSEEVKQALHDALQRGYERAMRQYDKAMEQYKARGKNQGYYKPQKPEPVKRLPEAIEFIEGKRDTYTFSQTLYTYAWDQNILRDLAPTDVPLVQFVRMNFAVGRLQLQRGPYATGLWWHDQSELEAYRDRCDPKFGLRELDAAVATLPGASAGAVVEAYLSNNTRWNSFCDWEPDSIWPAFAERPEILRSMLGASPNRGGNYQHYDYWWSDKRRNAFKVLAMFPQLPPEFIPMLWDLALGEGKSDRPYAQAALESVPDKTEKVVVALGDGKQAVRAAAAEWLGRIGDPQAIPPLKKSFRKEKQDFVKGTMMAALEALEADVSEFLDRKKLLSESKKGLAKNLPKGMEWISLESLPELHWQDSGKRVDPMIVQWWLVQGIRQKSPVAGPLLRRYLKMCRTDEVENLARYVLTSWIGRDTMALPHDEAAQKAKADTDRMWKSWGQTAWFADQYGGKKENLYQERFRHYSTACLGSAINQKGMLVFATAAGDRECVKTAERYIRKWYGQRMAQCKALIEVLAWIEHPLAIQVLLSIANRFRTKGIRKAAEEHVQAIAEREGWTLDELADRTIPDGGFERETDEEGRPVGDEAKLVLDYGPRAFTVVLGDDLAPVISRDDGKTVKNPPAPAKNDDPEKAKAAKKAFSEAKKTVKAVVKQQAERLFEALCTQRSWRFEDWQRYLAQHPIVGKLCGRLVWAAFEPSAAMSGEDAKLLGCFRPLEDGSLTDENDEEVDFDPETVVRLAHTCNVAAELGEAWRQHLQDYDVQPLFEQFGRETYSLTDEQKKESDVKDFEGHMLTTFKLRGKATRLGYVRGDAEDGGSFYLYRKPFTTLGVQAVIEFTGSYLPEEDVPAALTALYFTNIKSGDESESSWNPSKLRLGKVPPVLLSECYNDVKQIAAEGAGYDPDWQKKGLY